MFKKLGCICLSLAIMLCATAPCYAAGTDLASESDYIEANSSNNFDGAPVIGEFIADAELEALIKAKEEQFYQLGESIRNSRAASEMLLTIKQVPQEKDYWCGYAAIKSLLDFDNVSKTQQEIANEVYSSSYACPWYLSNGNDYSQFPVPKYLNQYLGDYWYYVPYPYGAAGTTNIDPTTLSNYLVATLTYSMGALACGQSSGKSSTSYLPGYPDKNIGHWIVIRGYKDNGNTFCIADPAKSSVISWSNNIEAYYTISNTTLAAFARYRGIVY